MALLTHPDFNGFSAHYAVPADVYVETLVLGAGCIALSTDVTQQVFDQLSTAIKCIHYLETNKLYSISPNEDINVISLRSKLLVLEITYIHQAIMNSYLFTYHDSEVKGTHRSMADTVSLGQVLASVGFRCIGLPWDTDSYPKMESNRADKNRPRIQVVDACYKFPTLPHTNLKDSKPIIIAGFLIFQNIIFLYIYGLRCL